MRIDLTDGRSLVQKLVGATILNQEKEGQITAMISTMSVDSDGDIIFQGKNDNGAGWVIDRFNKHPVMLWMHDHKIPSLGTAKVYLDKYKGQDALFTEANFDPEDEFARQIESKIRRGVLAETSVGFMAEKYDPIDKDNPWGGYNFYEQELIEFSWVNRGANPDVESFIKSACVSCPDIGKLILTGHDPELGEMRDEFIGRMGEFNTQMKGILNQMKIDVSLASDHCPCDDKKWNSLTELAKQISDTQAAFRGGK